jgi:hypothetical protein
VKIVTADGCEENKPVQVVGNRKPQQVNSLPGHQHGAKGYKQAAENKEIKKFSDPGQYSELL